MKNTFSILSWGAVSGGIEYPEQWESWAREERQLEAQLPTPQLEDLPRKVLRRLDRLGRCVMSVTERALSALPEDAQPAVVSTSRHGNLPFMFNLIKTIRAQEEISPTLFTYSVHNRFPSLVSMVSGFHGVSGAYSSPTDGFPLALAEAMTLFDQVPERPVLIISYEPEIPGDYLPLVEKPFSPHAAAFVVTSPQSTRKSFRLERLDRAAGSSHGSGFCLPFLKGMMTGRAVQDGYWRYVPC